MKRALYPALLLTLCLAGPAFADEPAAAKPKPTFRHGDLTIVTGSETGAMVGVEAWNRSQETEFRLGATDGGLAWRVRRGGVLGSVGRDKELDVGVKSDLTGRIQQPIRVELGLRKSSRDGRGLARAYLIGGAHGDRKLDATAWGLGVGAEVRTAGGPNDQLEIQAAIERFLMDGASTKEIDVDLTGGAVTRLRLGLLGKTPLKLGQKQVFVKGEMIYDGYRYDTRKPSTGESGDISRSSVTGLFSTGVAW